jgi:hypothetical protein
MRILGHPLTYPTKCYIAGGCGANVFAHTQGHGDFVLFDGLGWPWEIHSCYLNLLDSDGYQPRRAVPDAYTDQEWARDLAQRSQAYRAAAREASLDRRRRPIREIVKISPESIRSPVQICGYVQDIVEDAAKALKKSGTLGQQIVWKALGSRKTQITIIDSDFKSYTGFADVAQIVLGRGSTIVAVMHPTIVGLQKVFLFEGLDVLPIRAGQGR